MRRLSDWQLRVLADDFERKVSSKPKERMIISDDGYMDYVRSALAELKRWRALQALVRGEIDA